MIYVPLSDVENLLAEFRADGAYCRESGDRLEDFINDCKDDHSRLFRTIDVDETDALPGC